MVKFLGLLILCFVFLLPSEAHAFRMDINGDGKRDLSDVNTWHSVWRVWQSNNNFFDPTLDYNFSGGYDPGDLAILVYNCGGAAVGDITMINSPLNRRLDGVIDIKDWNQIWKHMNSGRQDHTYGDGDLDGDGDVDIDDLNRMWNLLEE